MAEPLIIGQGFAVLRDPSDDLLELVGSAPGPAGAIELALGGATLSLDAAEPGVIVGITAELDRGRLPTAASAAAFDALVGPDVRARALAIPADGHPRRMDPVPGRADVDRDLIVLALVAAAGAAPGMLPEERAVAALEAAALARRLDLSRWIDPSGNGASQAAELLADDVGEIARRPDVAGHVAALLDEYALITDVAALADRLRAMAAELRGDFVGVADVIEAPAAFELTTAGGAMPAAAPMAADRMVSRPRQAKRRAVSVAVDALPRLLADAVPRVTPTTGDEFEVRLRGWARRADGWWARVWAPADRVPLAVVPVRADGGDAVARFLAPAVWGDVVVGIVDDPSEPLPSAHAAAFRAAVATGKRAARHARLGDDVRAAAVWRASAELHRAAGDDWRAAVADGFATGGRRGGRPPSADPYPGRGSVIGRVVTDLLGPEP
jgi:hypothetical protein